MPQFYHTELKKIGLADGSAAKSTCSFYKGPTFGSHHPHKAAHNHLLSPSIEFQGIQWHTHGTYTYKHIFAPIDKNINKSYIYILYMLCYIIYILYII